MTSSNLTFGQFLFRQFSDDFVKRGMFGRISVTRGASIFGGVIVFQTGALLGRARAQAADELGRLLGLTLSPPATSMDGALNGWVERWRGQLIAEPSTLLDVWVGCEFPEVNLSDMAVLKYFAGTDSDLDRVLRHIESAAAIGVAYGRRFPQELERLWRQSYERVSDGASWSAARDAGLAIPAKQETVRLANAEALVLQQTAAYARAFDPELIPRLQLPTA